MTRTSMKNFCVEPTRGDCSCTRDIRCGGIIDICQQCPEHGVPAGAFTDLMKTHFHPIQGRPVGTRLESRYDQPKAS